MAKPKIDCEACEDLKEYVPELVQNGVTDKICASLKNDTGFKTNSRHTDCQDLDTANDCMIGQMDDRLEAYDACGWREFMHRIIPNMHAMYKMIICAICGLWTNIHALWDRIEIIEAAIEALKRRVKALEDAFADFTADLTSIKSSIRTLTNSVTDLSDDVDAANSRIDAIESSNDEVWCWLNNLTTQTKTYSLRAYDDQGHPVNGFRLAQGVHVVSQNDDPTAIPISIRSRGSVAFINGSVAFDGNMPTNYGTDPDTGDPLPWTSLHQGSPMLTNKDGVTWGKDGLCSSASPLVWEIQFKKCDVGFSDLFGRSYIFGADYMFRIRLWKAGDWVAPDWQSEPTHTVNGQTVRWPDAYQFLPDDPDMMLFQLRLQHTRGPLSANRMTPGGNVDVVPCPDDWSCS